MPPKGATDAGGGGSTPPYAMGAPYMGLEGSGLVRSIWQFRLFLGSKGMCCAPGLQLDGLNGCC